MKDLYKDNPTEWKARFDEMIMDQPEEILSFINGHSNIHYPEKSFDEYKEMVMEGLSEEEAACITKKDIHEIAIMGRVASRLLTEMSPRVSMFYSKEDAIDFTRHAAQVPELKSELCVWARDTDINSLYHEGKRYKDFEKLARTINMKEAIEGRVYDRDLHAYQGTRLTLVFNRENLEDKKDCELGAYLLTSYIDDTGGLRRLVHKSPDNKESVPSKLGSALLKLPAYKGMTEREAIIASMERFHPEINPFTNSRRKALFSIDPPANTKAVIVSTDDNEYIKILATKNNKTMRIIAYMDDTNDEKPRLKCYDENKNFVRIAEVKDKFSEAFDYADEIFKAFKEYERGRENEEKAKMRAAGITEKPKSKPVVYFSKNITANNKNIKNIKNVQNTRNTKDSKTIRNNPSNNKSGPGGQLGGDER